MKTNVYDKTSAKRRFLFSGFFANLYYFCALHMYLLLCIFSSAIGIAVILFFAELIFPQVIHIFNYSLTEKVFSELVADHKYHAAIAFMEAKQDLIETSKEPYKFRQELADCYTNTGDYPKALEQYRLLRSQMNEIIKKEAPENATKADIKNFKDIIDVCFLKEEFHIYLKMGDFANVRKYSKILREKHQSIDWDKVLSALPEDSQEELNSRLDGRKFEDGFRLELIQGKYLENPIEGIREMEKYAIDVANSKKYNQRYKLHLFNELICMLIEHDETIAARHYLEFALEIVDSLEFNSIIYPQLGELSEYCYQLDNVADGRRLLKYYLSYIDDTYERSYIDYAVAHAKEFKYLEKYGDWDKLTKRIDESSRALRTQIANNFTGMTSSQREYFIEQFRPVLTYINSLVEKHPTEQLATVAFDNNMFIRGLLLRSETSLGNAIASMNDTALTGKYNRYVAASQELVARQYVSGAGNYYARHKLEDEIARLESELTFKSMEFRRENESQILSSDQLKKSLANNDVALQFVEGDKSYFALTLDKKGTIQYIPLGNRELLNTILASRSAIYADPATTEEILSKLIPAIEGKNIYLSSAGIFNKISLSALPIGVQHKTIGDIADIHLVGSLADITAVKSRNNGMNLANRHAVLWGGIDYGKPLDSIAPTSDDVVLLRGNELRYLRNSLKEVNDIANLINTNGGKAKVISGKNATEKSLVSRSKKKDYILHISTHGFFHDNGAFANPMQNAGLLFANSQKYWMNDLIASTLNETDGILRADEIARLDLSGCRLVVLSACQTGLGKSDSEGVYGLQRAFKLAGAESILMSLWSVDDAATRELMTHFYRSLIEGKTPDYALTDAKNQLRREGASPDKWAAFVLLN